MKVPLCSHQCSMCSRSLPLCLFSENFPNKSNFINRNGKLGMSSTKLKLSYTNAVGYPKSPAECFVEQKVVPIFSKLSVGGSFSAGSGFCDCAQDPPTGGRG